MEETELNEIREKLDKAGRLYIRIKDTIDELWGDVDELGEIIDGIEERLIARER